MTDSSRSGFNSSVRHIFQQFLFLFGNSFIKTEEEKVIFNPTLITKKFEFDEGLVDEEAGIDQPKSDKECNNPEEDIDEIEEATEAIDLDFHSMKKKKKNKSAVLIEEERKKEEEETGDVALSANGDYTYDYLLNRIFNIMLEKNPDMVAGERKPFILRPPEIVWVGTKKTSFANFSEICKMMHRQPKHVLDFLLAELSTSGTVNSNNKLIMKGRFQQKQMESVLRRYVKEYVVCHTCRSPDTILQKESRLSFLKCESCGSRRSVGSKKSRSQAVTGKRTAIRVNVI